MQEKNYVERFWRKCLMRRATCQGLLRKGVRETVSLVLSH